MSIISILKDIESLYQRDKMVNSIKQNIIFRTYGLYVAPADEIGNKTCTSKNMNWKGSHITIAGFNENNKDIVIKILQFLEPLGIGIKHWKPNKGTTTITNKNIEIQSRTLNNLRDFLSAAGIQQLHNKDSWHIYCNEGVDRKIVDKTQWSLVMIERENNNITWTTNKINFYEIDTNKLNELKNKWSNFIKTDLVDISTSKIKVFSWNVSWKAMTGTTSGVIGDQCGKFPNNQCLNNVAQFIQSHGPYDFVTLQEASNWSHIQNKSSHLQNMKNISYKPKLEEMVTFYDPNKYQLDDSLFAVCSYFTGPGRPFIALFFKQKICVINMHPGHRGDVYNFNASWNQMLEGSKPGTYFDNNPMKNRLSMQEKHQLATKINEYKIIIIGDINNNLDNIPNFFGKTFYGKTLQPTCCDSTLILPNNIHSNFDHILYTQLNSHVTQILQPGKLHSDHLPVMAEIKL